MSSAEQNKAPNTLLFDLDDTCYRYLIRINANLILKS